MVRRRSTQFKSNATDRRRPATSCRRRHRHASSFIVRPLDPPRAAHRGWLLLVAFLVAGCATLGRGDGLRDGHLERLYFGRNIGDSAVVSDSAWAVFVRETITPAFPEGATVWDAAGQWRAPDGTVVRERSYVVELLHLVTPDVERQVQHVIDDYKRRFAQQSVLRMVTRVRASF
jgi:hypothetical protein